MNTEPLDPLLIQALEKRKAQQREYNRGYHETHKEAKRENNRKYRKVHKEATRERARIYRHKPSGRAAQQRANLKWTHDITVEEYNALFDEQGGRCAVCRTHQNELKRRLYVDHDHVTSRVRGLLCQNCNTILGHAHDNIETLENAITYLKRLV